MNVNNEISMNMTLEIGSFVVQAKKSNEILKEIRKNLQDTSESVKAVDSSISGLGGSFRHFMQMAATARFAVLDFHDVFLRLPLAILKTSGEIERMTKLMEGLSTASDKVADANRSRDFVFALAQNAPFEVKALTDAFVKLKSGGIDPMNGSLQALTDSVAKFGGSSDQLHRASISIQQMGGKAVISMEELRQQLGEAVPNAINMMAIGVGKSMSDLTKSISKGEVESKSALARMFAVMAVQNYGAASKMMDTWNGMIEQLKTKWELFKNEVGGGNSGQGVFAEARSEVKLLLESFDGGVARKFGADLSEGMYEMAHAARSVTEGIIKYYEEIKTLGQVLLVGFAASKIAGIMVSMKASLSMLSMEYRKSALEYTISEDQKVASSVNTTLNEVRQTEERIALMRAEVVAKQAQVAAFNTQYEIALATEAAAQNVANTRRIEGQFVTAALAAENAALAMSSRAVAEAALLGGNALHSETQVIRQDIAMTQALIVEKQRLVAATLETAGAATVSKTAMAGMGGVFTALGGWVTVLTAALMAAVWAWDKFGNAAEKNAEMARRAANKMSDSSDLVRAGDNVADAEKWFKENDKLGSVARMGEDSDYYKEKARLLKEAKSNFDSVRANLNEKSVNDFARAAEKESDQKIKSSLSLIEKETDAINQANVDAGKAIDDNEKLNAVQRAAAKAKIDKEYGAQTKAQSAKLFGEESRLRNEELTKIAALRDAEPDSLKKTAYQAQWNAEFEKKKTADMNLKNGALIGTDYDHAKGKGGAGGANSDKGAGSYTVALNNADRDLATANSRMKAQLGELTRVQAIHDEINEKFDALFKDEQLTVTERKGGKDVTRRLKVGNKGDEVAVQKLKDTAEAAKLAQLAQAALGTETKALSEETAAYEYNLNNSGDSSEFVNSKIRALTAEFDRQKDSLKGVDLALAEEKNNERKYIASKEADLAYLTRAQQDAAQTEIDLTIDAQEKIQKQFALTSKRLNSEYEQRRTDAIASIDAMNMTEEQKEAEKLKELARIKEAFDLKMLDSTKRFAEASKTPLRQLADQWSQSTNNMNKASAGWAQGFMDELTKVTTGGKADWRKFLNGMLVDMQRMSLEKTFGGMITGMFDSIGKGVLNFGTGSKLQGPTQSGGNLGDSGIGGMFSSVVSGAKKLVGAFMGTENAAKDVTAASTDSASQMIQEMLGITTKLTVEQSAAIALNALTVAAMHAAQALGGTTAGAAGGFSGLGGFGGLLGAIAGMFGSSGNVGAGDIVANTATTFSTPVIDGMSAVTEIPFANGGVMTSYGQLPLNMYARGGVANKPQAAIFGEGSMVEAYVPLPDGRSIPVTVTGGAGSSVSNVGGSEVIINIVVNNSGKDGKTETSTASGEDQAQYKKMANQIKVIVLDQMVSQQRPGGVLYRG